MRVTADTNVLVRAIVGDDDEQSRLARKALAEAELIAITAPALCELVWVLKRGYRIATPDIADTVRRLVSTRNVAVDRPAAEAGLAMLDAGGDFADGVIVHEGRWLGGEVFLSFDRQALSLAPEPAREPS